jgi:uncharacterized glyoxalase superfamily protein PhnB
VTDVAFNPLIPELYCTNCKTSLDFYVGLLGFRVLYAREEEGFAMIEREGAQIMLDEVVPDSKRSWIPAKLERPFGRGMNLEMGATDVAIFYDRVCQGGASIFLPLEEKTYRAEDKNLVVRQFIVSDPDGYLLRFSERLGEEKA